MGQAKRNRSQRMRAQGEGKHVSTQFPPERWDWGGERDRRS